MLGGKKEVDVQDTNSLEIDELANFAVAEHLKSQNSLEGMTFSKVVSCRKQVVQGTMYHLVIEVEESGKLSQYEAKVWVKPWENFKKLEDFKPKEQEVFTSADLGVRPGGPFMVLGGNSAPPTDKQSVPTDDPVVQEAAEHVIKTLQMGSNSLSTYELNEILSAEAELNDETAQFDLLLKTKLGAKEQVFKAEVSRTGDGDWTVKHATIQ
ncbi:cysteine proteinase inhibitor 6 [Physcomitrium patens]|jgi:hypothetical protein|uniref:Cysteine proteinase inhibitor n=1 Tax=Physcomitrium patens TaxID=3218 RepID=A0A2K1JEF1_PHYPA|nr:cysteine proteinase inhibitor 6-like [Physcomitrium patens]PNR39911.1 hypothetical protein PHYPA_020191 [Physcomitrium patens]|eukprot:XP_024397512.1 cysteine proteinase inhibitor 6-like [Physcomitrella patens]